eukprot:augustus_masked-scaffold_137-processed-gene-0.14-mRNA-1 protein AED:1.00 eAED:1.00 QI:0/-1/0/0/-1/1/1/0/1066
MGDFNCGRRDMLKLVSETSSFRVPPVPQTTSRLRGRKVIDHCVLQDGTGLTLRASDVLTTELGSDHYPVLSTFGHQPAEKYNTCEWKRTRFVPNRMRSADFGNHEKFAQLQKSCRFDILDEIDSSMETAEGRSLYKSVTNKCVEGVVKAAKEAALESGLLKYAETKFPKRLRIPKDVVRRLRKQRMIGAKIVNAKGPQKERLLQLWKESHKWCSKRIREEERSRLLYRHELAFQALTTDPRKFFRYSKGQMGNRRNLEEVYIKHPVTEELTDDPDTNQAAWTAYTEHLLKESSAPARDPEHWEQAFQQIERSTHELDNADEAPSDNELLFAIAALKTQKAAGIDGVPAEIFKAMALGNRNNSPAWRELCVALRAIFVLGQIPESQMTSLLVFIHKKGSKTDASNYRGISLMPVFIKILCKVVERRISEHLESRGFFHKGQAGFRKLEECPVQVFTLVEACQRRLYKSHENTYLGFVDLRKAYDSVPHEGLFRKLYLYGIRGRTLSFLRALYASSAVKVRTGIPGEYRISESIKVQKGLRQGCPLSPVLFNIYFNDVIRQYKGVAIPHERGKVLISHLMFADDLVILGESTSGLQSAMDELTGWLNKNNMKANASKCGVLRVTLNTSEPFNRPVMVDGEEIPYVRSYKYLGVNLDQSLSYNGMLKLMKSRGTRALAGMSRLLGRRSIPLGWKIRLIKSILIPCLTYGSGMVGCSRTRVSCLQSVLNKALRSAVGTRGGVSISLLLKEFDMLSINAVATARRLRLINKARLTKTYARELVQKPCGTGKWLLLNGSVRWFNRFGEGLVYSSGRVLRHLKSAVGKAGSDLPHIYAQGRSIRDQYLSTILVRQTAFISNLQDKSELKGMYKQLAKAVQVRDDAMSSTQVSMNKYMEYGYQPIAALVKIQTVYFALGYKILIKLRIGNLWLTERMAYRGFIPQEYKYKCPFCDIPEPETIEHYVFRCKAFQTERSETIFFPLPSPESDYIILNTGGCLSNKSRLSVWSLKEAHAIQRELKSATCREGYERISHMIRNIYPMVAFFEKSWRTRSALVRQLMPHGFPKSSRPYR